MIEQGETAPDFSAPGTEGDDIQTYSLDEYTDNGAVILVFYPFDFSPVCTEEMCTFRDAEWLSFTENIDVFGLSLDSCYAHKRFIKQIDLNFPLLTDTRGRITDEYGVAYDIWEDHKGVPKRALVTIDDSRTVRYTWKTDDAYEQPSLDELHQTTLSLVDGME